MANGNLFYNETRSILSQYRNTEPFHKKNLFTIDLMSMPVNEWIPETYMKQVCRQKQDTNKSCKARMHIYPTIQVNLRS